MTFAELKQELSDRGWNMLSATRRGNIVNRAAQQLDGMYQWPYKQKSTSGAAPLAISDLEQVRAVFDSTNGVQLHRASINELLDGSDDDLTTTGTPEYWYLDSSSGTPTIKVYPVDTVTLTVYYFKVPADMSGDSDTPASPARFHGIISDIAERMASREVGRPDNVSVTQTEIDSAVGLMVTSLLVGQGQAFVIPEGDDMEFFL